MQLLRGMTVFTALLLGLAEGSEWHYGSENWCLEFPSCCAGGGSRQSPINIVTSDTQYDEALANNPLNYSSGYFDDILGYIKDNGHTGNKFSPVGS